MSHQAKAAVLTLLKNSTLPVTAEEIANFVGIAEISDTSPTTRGYIRDLIEDGYCIGSNRKGYSMLTTAKEVQKYLNSLLKRQTAMSRRIQKVYDAAVSDGLL